MARDLDNIIDEFTAPKPETRDPLIEALYSGAIDPNDLDGGSQADVAAHECDECPECGLCGCDGECIEEDDDEEDIYCQPVGEGQLPVVDWPAPPTYSYEDAVAELRKTSALYMSRPALDVEIEFRRGKLQARPIGMFGVPESRYHDFEPSAEDRAATDWQVDCVF